MDQNTLRKQAEEKRLLVVPGAYKPGSSAYLAWRSGYLSALHDIADGELELEAASDER